MTLALLYIAQHVSDVNTSNCGVREKTNKMQQLDVYF